MMFVAIFGCLLGEHTIHVAWLLGLDQAHDSHCDLGGPDCWELLQEDFAQAAIQCLPTLLTLMFRLSDQVLVKLT